MYKKIKLKNGMTVVTAKMPGTKTITLFLMFKTGSKYETKKQSGLSHFLEHMFFKGTIKRPSSRDIANTLDAVGGEYNAMTSKEYTGYYAKVDASKIEVALDVISDIIQNSKFDKDEIDRERGVIVEELNMYQDNPMMHIEDLFESLLYGDSPAGWDTIGTKENITAFKRSDFVNYKNAQYGAENAVLAIAGNFQDRQLTLIQKYFSAFQKGRKILMKKTIENQKNPAALFHFKKSDQATLALGVRAFPLLDRDEFALRLLSLILGGSMSSRLFTELREKKGLCYHIRSSVELYSDTGYLAVIAGVRRNDLADAIQSIIAEFRKFIDPHCDLVELDRELQQAKEMIKGRLSIEMEASDHVASWYARQAMFRKKISDPSDIGAKYEAVSVADIIRVSKRIFRNDALNLALISDLKETEKYRKLLKF